MNIAIDTFADDGIVSLMRDHLVDMYATSPPESVHALDLAQLRADNITFWSARNDGQILGCIALKQLDASSGEIKSMRTTEASRGQGVGGALLTTLMQAARDRGYHQLLLETGSQKYFDPARRLYARFGFEVCGPFADYRLDPNSVFMRFDLATQTAGG